MFSDSVACRGAAVLHLEIANKLRGIFIACTLNHIRKQSENVQALMKPLYDGMQAVATARGFSMEGLMAAVGSNSVRELMEMVLVDADTISAIDRSLREIENLR